MAKPNAESRALYNRLREVLGDDHADTLMTYLPPLSAVELATKSDIAELKTELKADMSELKKGFERVNDRIDTLHYQLADLLKTFTFVMVGTLTALTAILGTAFAVAFS